MAASNSTQEIDAPGKAPDTQVVQRPPAAPPRAKKPPIAGPAPKRKSLPAPEVPAASPPVADAVAAAEAREDSRLSLFLVMNSWLVSMAIHAAAIVALGLVLASLPQQVRPVAAFIDTAIATYEPLELVESVHFEVAELKVPQHLATEIGAEPLTSGGLGDGGGTLGGLGSGVGVGEVAISAPADIGVLFAGEGRKAMGSGIGSGGKSAAEFFGVKATGRRFVFIVDSSNSMRGAKFTAAKEELMYAIRKLSKDQAFYIIFFDWDADRMLLMPDKEPPLLPVPATADNIHRVEYWINGVQNELKTNPFDAVKFAIEMVPDAIYLLTDGKFTDGGRTVRFLKEQNVVNDPVEGYRPKVVIHTICFGQKDGEETLQAIAKEYRGTYRYVPIAKKK